MESNLIKFVVAWVTTGGMQVVSGREMPVLFDYGLETVAVEEAPRDSARMRASMAFRDRMKERLRANGEWELGIRPSFKIERMERL
jgi:hypothetical protein